MLSFLPRYRREDTYHDDDLCFLHDDDESAAESRTCISSLMGKSDLQRGLALAREKELQAYRQSVQRQQQRDDSTERRRRSSRFHSNGGYHYQHKQQEQIHVYMFGDELAESQTMMTSSVASSSFSSSSSTSSDESTSDDSTWCTTPSTIEVRTTRQSNVTPNPKNTARSTPEAVISIIEPLGETHNNLKINNINNKAAAAVSGICTSTNQAKHECKSKKPSSSKQPVHSSESATNENNDNKDDDENSLLTFHKLLYDWGGEVEEWNDLLEWGDLANDTMDATKTCTKTMIANTPMMTKIFGPNRRDSKKERRSISSYISFRKKQGGGDVTTGSQQQEQQQQHQQGHEVSVDM